METRAPLLTLALLLSACTITTDLPPPGNDNGADNARPSIALNATPTE